MRKRTRVWIAAGLIAAIAVVGFTGCGNSKSDDSAKTDSSAKTVTIAGSTSVQPLSEYLADKYKDVDDSVKIDVQGGGSGQAAKSLDGGIAQIGALSREVNDEEKSSITKEYTIALDGVGIIVNEDVDIDDITMDQLKDIYTGKITNWKEVGGNDEAIAVVSREEGSGTRGAFTELTGVLVKDDEGNETDNTTKDVLVQSSTGAAVKTVGSTPGAIGYVSLESIDDTVKAVKVEGVEASADTVLDGTYKLQRPFVYATNDDVTEEAQAFIDWVMSDEGQKYVEKAGFIPKN